jgi:DNA-3-methyladenine glycosylase I
VPPLVRCSWSTSDPLSTAYHDAEWGVPLRDDRALFEFLVLEGAQAGLSWVTILKKREAYRLAFGGFDAAKMARYREAKIEKLLANEGIVRNRLKIQSAIGNARACLEAAREFGSFSNYIWTFTGGEPIQNAWKTAKDTPARSAVSDRMSKDLKQRGFTFVGSTICYAFMQATGMVNDHLVTCFRYAQLRR